MRHAEHTATMRQHPQRYTHEILARANAAGRVATRQMPAKRRANTANTPHVHSMRLNEGIGLNFRSGGCSAHNGQQVSRRRSRLEFGYAHTHTDVECCLSSGQQLALSVAQMRARQRNLIRAAGCSQQTWWLELQLSSPEVRNIVLLA